VTGPLAQQFARLHTLVGLRETLTLKETLEAAPPGPWRAIPHVARAGMFGGAGAFVRAADDKTVATGVRSDKVAELIALAPELAAEVLELRERHREAMALVLDMGEELRHQARFDDEDCGDPDCEDCKGLRQRAALLARLDQLGKEQR